jgi:hypothetical protein
MPGKACWPSRLGTCLAGGGRSAPASSGGTARACRFPRCVGFLGMVWAFQSVTIAGLGSPSIIRAAVASASSRLSVK